MNPYFLESYVQKRFTAVGVPLTVRQAFGYMLDANCGTLFVNVKGSYGDATTYEFGLHNGEITLESVRGEASTRDIELVRSTLCSRDYVFVKRALVIRPNNPFDPSQKGDFAYRITNFYTGEVHTSPMQYTTQEDARTRAEEKVLVLLENHDALEAKRRYQLLIETIHRSEL
jgi:hypothetical protein